MEKNYVLNRQPLMDVPFVPLTLGSISTNGWLRKQLELQRDNLTGDAEEYFGDLFPHNEWLGGKGGSWERAPYYTKGLIALAYSLQDYRLIEKSKKWINWCLENQWDDGNFGPEKMAYDWWPKMPMLFAIVDHYEATKDERVLPFLTKYFQFQYKTLNEKPLENWAKARFADNMTVVIWLYNITGEAFLLELVELLKTQGYDWLDIYTNNRFMAYGHDFHPKHGVNVAQAMKMPATYYQLSKDEAVKDAYYKGDEHLMREYGQVYGMHNVSEFLSSNSTTDGVELCGIVERMFSDSINMRIFGDAEIGDTVERLAFNALPGAALKDYRGTKYYTLANEVKESYGMHGYNVDYPHALMPGPMSGCGCCSFNWHMGWPYFAKNSWAATNDGGIANMLLSPTEVKFITENGNTVKIIANTNYPFDEKITYKFNMESSENFPFKIRIPAWCKNATIAVNGAEQKQLQGGMFFEVGAQWNDGDIVTLNLPMNVTTSTWTNQSVAVERGPIIYSLKMGEQKIVHAKLPLNYTEYEIFPTTDWNYGLVINKENPENDVKVIKGGYMPANPFESDTTPVKLKIKAKKVNQWHYAWNKMVAQDPPYSPVESDEETEEITLVPFGAQMLRVTCFPQIGKKRELSTEYEYNFKNGCSGDYIKYGGQFIVNDGMLCTAVPSNAHCIASSTDFADFTYEAKVVIGENSNAGLIFRVSNPGIGEAALRGYYADLRCEGKVNIWKYNGWGQKLAECDFDVKLGEEHTMKVVANGSKFQVFMDGNFVLEAEDGEFKHGTIGIKVIRGDAKWNCLKVKSL